MLALLTTIIIAMKLAIVFVPILWLRVVLYIVSKLMVICIIRHIKRERDELCKS